MMHSLDRQRLEAMILYIADKCRSQPNFGKTKLFKLLFWSEMAARGMLGKPISGWSYVKDQFGPVPQDHDEILLEMQEAGAIRIKSDFQVDEEPTRQVVLACKRPSDELLTQAQRHLMDRVINEFWDEGAVQLSNKSHEDIPGWEGLVKGYEVPPQLLFLVPPGRQVDPEEAKRVIDDIMIRNADLMAALA